MGLLIVEDFCAEIYFGFAAIRAQSEVRVLQDLTIQALHLLQAFPQKIRFRFACHHE